MSMAECRGNFLIINWIILNYFFMHKCNNRKLMNWVIFCLMCGV